MQEPAPKSGNSAKWFLTLSVGYCGTCERADTSDPRGPGFESSDWHILLSFLLLTVCTKTT